MKNSFGFLSDDNGAIGWNIFHDQERGGGVLFKPVSEQGKIQVSRADKSGNFTIISAIGDSAISLSIPPVYASALAEMIIGLMGMGQRKRFLKNINKKRKSAESEAA